ncbi:hemerythrin domain-containing protein [Desulfopila inferna]|uniref:hemerythrin domain-containing protein n=1 Tax=Desulfopila inferna TaxID=468528 RepID=UPI001964F6C7|nr:hemerythrin domain-containing protein [Desulfopila inferna]MBM9604928.1 hemerythrin domain-containing protein [Desulfopila inferna]
MSEHKFLLHLREDHQEQKELGRKLVEAKSSEDRQKLRQQFYSALYPHMVGEEASMFKLLSEADDEEVKDDALEGLQEHHVAKIILREIMEIDTQSAIFKAKAKVLDEINRHHIEEEEEDVFGHLKKMCSEDQMDELFEKYEKAEDEVES